MPELIDIVPSPEIADPTLALLMGMLDNCTANWREELGEVTPDEIVWQPRENGHSIGGLILHIAHAEAGWIEEVCARRAMSAEERERLMHDAIDQYACRWPPPPRRPLAWYDEALDDVRRRTRETVRALADPMHIGRREDKEFTLRFVLYHLIRHEAYHGGQAVLLSILQRP